MKEHLRIWTSIFCTIMIPGFVLILIYSISLANDNRDIESSPNQFIAQLPDDIPDFVKDILREEGVDFEELKNDPELRREIREKVMDDSESQEEFSERKAEEEMGEASPREAENEQPGPRWDELKGRYAKNNGRLRLTGGGVDEYYKSIVDNNLFRPLGWGGEKRGPAFRLIGTVISRNQKPKALIFEFSNNITHYVAVGDKVGNATVESIDEKSVKLNQEAEGTLTLNIVQESPFLGGSVGGKGGGGPNISGNSPPKINVRSGGAGERLPAKLRERFQKMSREEREKSIRRFREARERGGGRNLDRGERPMRREVLRRR